MKVTASMIQSARRAEYDYYQRGRAIGSERFIPAPDEVIRAMLEAAVGSPPPAPVQKKAAPAADVAPGRIEPPARQATIITASKPKPRR